MHLWYKATAFLDERLKGDHAKPPWRQFLMERSKDGLVYRGEIMELFIPDMKQKTLCIKAKWLCQPYFGVDALNRPVAKWRLIKPFFSLHPTLRLDFGCYYFQRKRGVDEGKEPREERVKFRTSYGEIWRLFRDGDPTNLRQLEDGEFVPGYQIPGPDLGPDD